MKLFILRTALIFSLILAGGFWNFAMAIDETYAAPQLKGNQIRKDSFSVVADTIYFNPSLKPLQRTNEVRNLITLRINEDTMMVLPDNFSFKIFYKVYYKKASGPLTVLDSTALDSLEVKYDKNDTYFYRAIRTFKDGIEAKVVIKDIKYTGNLADFEKVIILENEIFVNRSYNFSCVNNVIPSVSYDDDLVASTGELRVSWGIDRAAEEYDLEWTYVDDSALADYKYPDGSLNADAIFLRNASRVSITSNEYYIPLLYDTKGRLFFRARSVQVKPDRQRIEANWSSVNTAGLGEFPFAGHDRNFNWQSSTSFAEEGKRKSVVQYFDGSLRGRQTVTKDNTTNKTIVAENFYDFQGRPVIQVMPAPSMSNIISYTPRFNSLNGAEYDKTLFDKEADPGDVCEAGAPPLDSAISGASHYYSSLNPLTSSGIHQYIPKSYGFPFTEVRYLPDNTGRVSMQSGVGPAFQIGQHATRFYYGTADQEELDALFGTDVGINSHYYKNMVRDANGQYSISYVDMFGRTIATALAGNAPDSMQVLDSNDSVRVVKNLLDSTSNIVKGTSIESSRGLIVTKKSDHRFKYSLLPDSLSLLACNNLPVCYDCKYDLEITVTDECGKSIVIRKTNVGLTNEADCGVVAAFPAVDTTFKLDEGNYTITKKLTINQAVMDYYRSVFLSRNTCKTYDSFLVDQKAALNSLVCELDCSTCMLRLGTRETFPARYFTALNVPEGERAARSLEANMAFNRLQQECAALCGKKGLVQRIREQMLMDLTPPSGQYANPDKIDQFSIFKVAPGGIAPYQISGFVYLDETGVRENAQAYDRNTFISNFKSTWAETILQLHPEYRKLILYEQLEADSHGWEEDFQNTETFQEAVAKGYLNPAGFGDLPSDPEFDFKPATADSMFVVEAAMYIGDLKDRLDNMSGNVPGVGPINAWSLATIMAHCKNGDLACVNTYKPVSKAFDLDSSCSGEIDFAWKYFRGFYLQARRMVIQDILDQEPYNNADPTGYHHLRINFNSPDPGSSGYPQTSAGAEEVMRDSIKLNCEALAVQWIEDLKLCNITSTMRDSMIKKMVQVCKEGGDAQHLFGAATVRPSSTNTDRSFEQVMRNFLGSNYNSNCNVYLITAPRPYGSQPAMGEKTLYSQPDSCECATISGLYGNYTFKKISGETFSDYVYRTSGTRITQGSLDTLRKACNGEINCSFLKEPITIPPVLQCGVKDVCVGCYTIDTLYAGFRREFPGIAPARDNNDSLQRSRNRLFEKYMNYHLGFGKSTMEYLSFMDSCKIKFALIDTLDQIQQAFRNTRHQNFGVNTTYSASSTETYSSLQDLSQHGLLLLPDSIRQRTVGGSHFITVSQKSPATWCWQNGYDAEGKFRFLKRTAYDTGFSINAGGNVKMEFALFKNSFIHNGITYTPGLYLSGIKDTSGGQYGAVYGGSGFEYKRLSADTNSLQNWNIFKLVIRPGYYDVYWNGKLIHHTVCSPAITLYNSSFFKMGLPGGQGCLDYVKFSDVSAVRYYEEYENAALPAIASAAYFCPATVPDCQTDFTQYFNLQRGTSYNYNEISSLYGAAGISLTACAVGSGTTRYDTLTRWLNDYKKYGGIPHLDASGVDTTKWRPNYGGSTYALGIPLAETMRNGVFSLPKYYTDTTRGKRASIDIDYYDTLCLPAEGFDFEFRAKLPDSMVNENFFKAIFLISLYPIPPADHIQTGLAYVGGGAAVCAVASDTLPLCSPFNVPVQSLDHWRTIKWEYRGNRFRYYIDDLLLAERPLVVPFTSFKFLTIKPYSLMSEIDYVRFKDVSGRILFNEEFDDPFDLAVPDRSMKCEGCEVDFSKYYNRRNGTNLTYSAIVSQLKQSGIAEPPCPETGKTLCGKSEPVFPVMIPRQHQACDDSTLFAASAATILHDLYRDSLLNSFDDRYLAKCLEVKKTEQFTVEHSVNEYHYTLYYYDQAGNLVRTIPPSGVDVSKFKWAVNWSDSVRTARKADAELRPNHKLPTDYRYNTLNQVVEQKSPDGGRSEFWYDRLGRLAVSQNAKQRNVGLAGEFDWNYSYTRYDNLGRIREVGEVRNLPGEQIMSAQLARNNEQLDVWHIERANNRSQITTTLYDTSYSGLETGPIKFTPKNLRSRVSATFISEGSNPSLYNQATLYSYDIHGNVDALLQDYGLSSMVPNIMNRNGNRFKVIEYDYDLISGKVNNVKYQPGWADQFYHRYRYDAENRLTLVETSQDGYVWQKDARYEYYLHGPLARTVIGEQAVQGVDYAYTLQGWLKGVNSSGAGREHDMGEDGKSGSINWHTARDAYGFALNYYIGDYQPSNAGKMPFPGYYSALGARSRPLYNGNISSMVSTIRRFEDRNSNENGPNLFFTYKYDQLNRLVGMDTDTGFNIASNSYPVLNKLKGFNERITYDANGNIQKLLRNSVGDNPLMDSLTYSYYPGTNQLRYVRERDSLVPDNKWGSNDWDFIIDIDSQRYANNYEYDSIGNLIRDSSERIWRIKWNVYGKIEEINRYAGPKSPFTKIRYHYDASGNRIGKEAEYAGDKLYEWYVRDAQGNILSVYNSSGYAADLSTLGLSQVERNIYGSSRLGSAYGSQNVDGSPWDAKQYFTTGVVSRGLRQYELSNHLGNVLTTISDKKFGVSSNGSLIDYYEPHMVTGTDYYPFGMPMRFAGSTTGQGYRFGFNGKENDNEVKWGTGNQQNYGMRIYDPRLGRFLSEDPITKDYPELTPYQFSSNSPIANIDIDGLEGGWSMESEDNRLKMLGEEKLKVNMWEDIAKRASPHQIIKSDIYGNTLIGTPSFVDGTRFVQQSKYNEQLGDAVRNGLGGSIGYIFGKDKGAFTGAALDMVAMGFTGIPERSSTLSRPQKQGTLPRTPTTSTGVGGGNRQAASNVNYSLGTTNNNQAISAKMTKPQVGLAWNMKEYRTYAAEIVNGNLQARGVGLKGEYDFVVTQDGKLRIGVGHYHLSGSAPTVQAAGVLKVWDGKISWITNQSGHYRPSQAETAKFEDIFKQLGLDVSGRIKYREQNDVSK